MVVSSDNLPGYVAYYIAELGGPQSGAALHSLLEAGPAALPLLEEALAHAAEPRTRASIVEVIWQLRDPRAVPILASCLSDTESVVWKEALDGLVALGGPEAVSVLRAALSEAQRGAISVGSEWISEALAQIGAGK